MSLHKEVALVAYELFEKNGQVHGRDLEHWLDAERIVSERHCGGQSAKVRERRTAQSGKTLFSRGSRGTENSKTPKRKSVRRGKSQKANE